MNYNSVAEIYDDIEGTRASLLQSVEGLSDEQQTFRPAPERWSVAEIVEHLSMVEGGVVRVVGSLLKKGEAGGHPRGDAAPFAPVSIADAVEQTRDVKLEAPETARPAGAPFSDSLDRLRDSRAALLSFRPRVKRLDGTLLRFPHPIWGPINLYQWLLFVGAHEQRHLAQIEALKETMNAGR
jgi:DinB superfamily